MQDPEMNAIYRQMATEPLRFAERLTQKLSGELPESRRQGFEREILAHSRQVHAKVQALYEAANGGTPEPQTDTIPEQIKGMPFIPVAKLAGRLVMRLPEDYRISFIREIQSYCEDVHTKILAVFYAQKHSQQVSSES